ncbi:hypothetical protein SAY86_013290 [Trapa natans]|uniref:Cytochrome c oxidase subunit 6b-1 n=1 Tax=Trapa natans TaxID=22666 RepID=A0AAN7LY31_TRANT|nr:hypothetical protein SAY86_013290 [Trapa natans]
MATYSIYRFSNGEVSPARGCLSENTFADRSPIDSALFHPTMAEAPSGAPPSLVEAFAFDRSATVVASEPMSLSGQYALKEKEEKSIVTTKYVDVKEPEILVHNASEEVSSPAEVPPTDVTPPASEESTDATTDEPSVEKAEEVPVATGAIEENTASSQVGNLIDAEASEMKVENTASSEEGNLADVEATEEPSEIKLETAPADFRFPTTNQTRHCFTRYIEYHRCIAAKGEDAPECDKFAKYYRSLCPGEWIEKWNEQRENGTFPGPL